LLDIITRTAHWVGWHRHFGPLSGSDPKLADPLGRYSVVTFTYGTNTGPYQMSRHLRGTVSAHETSAPGNQHITAAKLNQASADVIDAFRGIDIAQLWGDGSKVGAYGTQIDTWDDNLLAETSIRYGGYGSIAYRHISNTYIALFSHFIPCGVWEAVFIFAGLLENESKTTVPEEIHADTQGQSLPAFGLATMLEVELLPRIRNWKDLIFHRPNTNSRYDHINTLFGPNEIIDWKPIETHWVDLIPVVISIRQARISSSALGSVRKVVYVFLVRAWGVPGWGWSRLSIVAMEAILTQVSAAATVCSRSRLSRRRCAESHASERSTIQRSRTG